MQTKRFCSKVVRNIGYKLNSFSLSQIRRASNFAAFNVDDPLNLSLQLTEEELLVQETAKNYAETSLKPRITQQYRDESYDPDIIPEMGELGLLGSTIEGYDCAGMYCMYHNYILAHKTYTTYKHINRSLISSIWINQLRGRKGRQCV